MLYLKVACAGVAVCAVAAAADTVDIPASRDNTLYESPTGNLSNALGSGIFAGRNGSGLIRRALIRFDVPAFVPAGSTITGATLTLYVSQTQSPGLNVSLHRCFKNWGEGTSNADPSMGGGGAPATTGDATWLHTFYSTQFWSASGGTSSGPSPDFAGAASALTTVGPALQFYTWGPAPSMTADVQAWLDQPTANFGWVLIADETLSATAKRFDSRESTTAANRPVLHITYTRPVCYPNCDSSTAQPCLNVQDFGCFLNSFASGQTYANCDNSTIAPVLNIQDFACFLNRFALGCSAC